MTRDDFVGVCSLAFYFWMLEVVSFYSCWCFYTLGLFSVISHTIILHTFQPYDCLDIAFFFSGYRAFTRLSAAVVAALVKLE